MQKLNYIQEYMNFKEGYGRGTFSYTGFCKDKTTTHFHFLNNGYYLLAIYNLPQVLLGNSMHYFV